MVHIYAISTLAPHNNSDGYNTMTWRRFLLCWSLIGGFPSQWACNAELWCFVVVNMNNLFNKQSRCSWFHTPWCSCHCNAISVEQFSVHTIFDDQILKYQSMPCKNLEIWRHVVHSLTTRYHRRTLHRCNENATIIRQKIILLSFPCSLLTVSKAPAET